MHDGDPGGTVIAEATPARMDPQIAAALTEWNNVKQQIAGLQARELQLRTHLLTNCFDPEFVAGSRTIPLWQGWRLRGKRSWDYKLTDANGETRFALAQLRPETANNVVRWKPDLSVSGYKALDEAAQRLFTPALTIKPESPQLELLAPNQPETPTLY